MKSEHPQFTVVYYEGSRRVKRKFADIDKSRAEAELASIKLANGEAEVLELTGTDRADYVHANPGQKTVKGNADYLRSVHCGSLYRAI